MMNPASAIAFRFMFFEEFFPEGSRRRRAVNLDGFPAQHRLGPLAQLASAGFTEGITASACLTRWRRAKALAVF
jgi:hypothetical protein